MTRIALSSLALAITLAGCASLDIPQEIARVGQAQQADEVAEVGVEVELGRGVVAAPVMPPVLSALEQRYNAKVGLHGRNLDSGRTLDHNADEVEQ